MDPATGSAGAAEPTIARPALRGTVPNVRQKYNVLKSDHSPNLEQTQRSDKVVLLRFSFAWRGWPRGDASAVTVGSPERSSGRDIGICLGALARCGSRGGGARSIFPRSPAGLRPIDRWTRPSWSARRRGRCLAAATHSAAAPLL